MPYSVITKVRSVGQKTSVKVVLYLLPHQVLLEEQNCRKNIQTVMTEGQPNSTTYIELQPPYVEVYWLTCESLLIVLTVLCVHIGVCLLKHALEKEKARDDHTKTQRTWLKWLPVFTSATLFLRLCSDHVSAFYGWQDDSYCFITVTVSTVLYTLSLYGVYIFLWIRQSIFYAHPIMKKSIRPCVTFFSWFSLAFMLASGFSLGALYNIPQATGWVYKATHKGCMEVSEDSPEVIPGVVAASTAVFQVTLLALFVYPLVSRRTEEFRSEKIVTPTHSGGRLNQTTTLSLSEEKHNDYNEVFENPDQPSTSKGYAARGKAILARPYRSRALSSLNSDRERRNFRSETDTESGPDTTKADNEQSWGQNHAIKRETPILKPDLRKPNRKSIFYRISSLSANSIFYRRTKINSANPETVGSPNTSDSEARTGGRLSTLKRRGIKTKKTGKKMVTMMKKYTWLMVICVLSDVGSGVLQILYVLPELVYLVLFDASLMVNLICVVLTFKEWEAILMPCTANPTPTPRKIRLQSLPTPVRKAKTTRVRQLKLEDRRRRSRGSSRRSSGSLSGHESDYAPHAHIYQPKGELKSLL